ncbi:EF hand associated-domain-containing protein [Dichotomocladium elegans]|nr:EF hand associated-domain-containing protein [Dichotomocladium elegans]
MGRDIRILLVGDEGAGKSTLITSLIKEAFVPDVQLIVPEVTIPPEMTSENVTLHIIDSSTRPEYREQLETEICRAQVICIVYAIDDPDTLKAVPLCWLPYIRSFNVNVPLVLVGNKIDLRAEGKAKMSVEEDVFPIMANYKEIETCIECSGRLLLNVAEVFDFAQKAVLHPRAPIYDSQEQTLKPPCLEALTRIFTICDTDKDGILNDEELNEFQRKCFGAPLQPQELEGVKDVVRNQEPSGINKVGLTKIGFAFLHTQFIQRGRVETVWTVLRKFGYNDDLALRKDYLSPLFDHPADCTVELSPSGYQFFKELFLAFDKDNDAILSQPDLDALFSIAPESPWGDDYSQVTATSEHGAIPLQSWLALWSMTTLLDCRKTLKYLAYLGFDGDTRTALKLVRPLRMERKKKNKSQKAVLHGYVLGAPGSGKTALLQAYIGKPFISKSSISEKEAPRAVVVHPEPSSSSSIRGVDKYLVLEEVESRREGDVLLAHRQLLDACDFLCFVYDVSDPDSFGHIISLREQYKLDHLPSLVVAAKSDLAPVKQRLAIQPETYCRNQSLPPPLCVSAKGQDIADLGDALADIVATHP